MVSKTRDRLIEVARQLFVRKGVDNTTMLDIATASDRGRRTLYTYFRNKREIHQAVIEKEGEQAVATEREIERSDRPASEKLREILMARYRAMRCETNPRSYDARQLMVLLEGKRGGKIRRIASIKEYEIFRSVLDQGVASGEFCPEIASKIGSVVVLMLLGLDSASSERLQDIVGVTRDEAYAQAVDCIVHSISTGSVSDSATSIENHTI